MVPGGSRAQMPFIFSRNSLIFLRERKTGISANQTFASTSFTLTASFISAQVAEQVRVKTNVQGVQLEVRASIYFCVIRP